MTGMTQMTSPRKTTSSPLQVRKVLLPKREHDLSECEDAFAINMVTNRFAIADGATEAFDAAGWAQRLAGNWVEATDLLTPEDFWTWLENEGQTHNDSWSELDLPWYSAEKRREGSFAAFVGVEVELPLESPRWTAIALGDSCLVHSRGGVVQTMFPVSNSADFGSAPILAPSCTAANLHARSAVATKHGEMTAGDELLLLSDALAAWYLKLNEQRDKETKFEFERLLQGGNDSAISNYFERQRSTGRLKDDDIAIVTIEF
jgi:hypothetical protein